MNEENYQKLSNWFRKKQKRLKIFYMVYRISPLVVVTGYLAAVIYEVFFGTWGRVAAILLVPAVTFFLCTIFRKVIDAKRPYEEMHIQPLVHKEKTGQSFPSRHTVSASVIAMAAWYVHPVFGACMLLVAAVIGGLRPMAGVHYIKDVVAGFVAGVVCGWLGFYMIGLWFHF